MDEITILIIEDDEDIRESVKILLENEGFHVIEADNGMDGLHQISEDTDLVILDIMMPGISGIKTCEQIRKISYVPILFLTAKSSENDKIIGFTAGADDYLVKPFSYAELLARIKALLRRKQVYTCGNMKENGQNVWIKKGDLKINTTGNKVFSGDEEIYLTETEYEILSLMLKYRGKIFSVQNIYESVWQEPFFNNSANTVMVHIRKLRLKIEKNPQKPQIIQTVWGKDTALNKRKRKHLMEKMIGILLLGFFLALLLFLLIFFMGNGALNRYFESSMYRRNVSKETIAMFQEYVSRHHLAASDTERIREWAKENHIGYFTISRKRMLLYDNYYALPVALDRTKSEQLHYTWQYFQEVSFTDGNADVFIYVNRERKYYILVDVAAALCGVLVWIGVFAFGVSGYVRYIRQLSGEVAKLEDGLWSVDFTIKGEDELTDLARGLEHMKTVLLEKEEKERNMKKAQNKLVLGMAHDLRTPLTALMAYLEIIKREPEHDKVKLYVKKTVGKAIQIKNLSDQLFEFFLINSGQQPQMEKSESIAFVMEDYCSELCNVLQTNGYTVTLGWKQ